jgi:hypothetical protein
MITVPKTGLARLRMAAAGLLMFALAACATPFNANVSRFQSQLPAPAGQTFAIVADDPAQKGGIEFGQYADDVAANLTRLGYARASDPAQAQLIVQFGYSVDGGRTRIQSSGVDPFWGGWYGGGWGGGFGGRFGGGWGGRFGGRGFYGAGLWNYGWYDPWFNTGVESYTVYTSKMILTIADPTGKHLFEGRAEAVSTSNRLQYLVPNLVQSMFTNFPGNSGETVRITVAPEKPAKK